MANQGEGALRGARKSIDTGTGSKRLGNSDRAAHISRGTFVDFYDDLGIATTKEGAKLIRADEKLYKGEVKRQQGVIDTNYGINESNAGVMNDALGQAALAETDYTNTSNAQNNYQELTGGRGYTTYLGNQINSYKKSGDLTRVTLLSKAGNTVKSWYLPTETARSLYDSKDTDAWYAGGNRSDVHLQMKHNSLQDTTRNELEKAWKLQENEIKSGYLTLQKQDKINRDTLGINFQTATTNLETAYNATQIVQDGIDAVDLTILTQEEGLAGYVGARASEWAEYHAIQDRKVNNMRDFFNTLDLSI